MLKWAVRIVGFPWAALNCFLVPDGSTGSNDGENIRNGHICIEVMKQFGVYDAYFLSYGEK